MSDWLTTPELRRLDTAALRHRESVIAVQIESGSSPSIEKRAELARIRVLLAEREDAA